MVNGFLLQKSKTFPILPLAVISSNGLNAQFPENFRQPCSKEGGWRNEGDSIEESAKDFLLCVCGGQEYLC